MAYTQQIGASDQKKPHKNRVRKRKKSPTENTQQAGDSDQKKLPKSRKRKRSPQENTQQAKDSDRKESHGTGIQKRKKRLRKKRMLRRLEPRVMLDAAAVTTAFDVAGSTPESETPTKTAADDAPTDNRNSNSGLFDAPEASPDFSHEGAREIIFIDSRVDNPDQLIAAIESDAITYTLDPVKDGVQQIADILANHQDLSAIHLVSHGDDGQLFLGEATLSDHSLAVYNQALTAWGESLSENGDIIIWGCKVAETETGQAFVDHLSEVTGADIAASTDITGGDAHGGDFDLEYERGDVEEDVLDDAQAAAAYDGTLAAPTAISLTPAGASNLIINGGFENPDVASGNWGGYTSSDVPGWNASDHLEIQDNYNGHTASEGDQWLELDYAYQQDSVYQDIQTVDGQSYTLSLDLSQRPGTGSSTNEVEIYWRGTLLESITPASTNWQTYSFAVTGSGGLDRLEFREPATANSGEGSLIDNVRLTEEGTASISENAANGTAIGTLTGTDPDAGDSLTYGLTDNAGGRFAIDSATGVITVANGSLLNHEANASHQITAQVTDAAGETFSQSFTITVTDLNENPTNLSLDTNSVNENAANGTAIGTLTGTDPDAGDSLTYGLTDNAGGRFAIDSATGVITVANGSLLNHEANASHQITAQVTDADGESYTQIFTITVNDLNETPNNLSLDTNNVSENAANGTTVGTLTGTDPDAGDSLTYGLTDTAGGRFAIDSATGVITVANGSLLNHEANASHQITAQVTDADGESFSQSFTITVDDLNETPTNLSLDTNNVSENAANGTAIGTLTGTDPDAGDSLTYGLTNTAGGRFAIDSATGVITVANGSLLNHEANASHQITAQVTDADGESYTQIFTITVTDLNETPNNLSLDTNNVSENAANGTAIGTLTGTDPDAGDSLTYGLTDTAGGRFAIDSATGVITVANGSLLNHEANASHQITAQVTDADGETHTQSFTITVDDLNETPTNLSLDTNNVSENAANGTTVGTLTGTDPDAGDSLTYGLTDNAGGRFAIDSATGAITVANGSLLNHEDNASHQITAQVTDADGETHTQSFTITVDDLNETPTNLSLDTNNVSENAANGTAIGTLTGTDPDAGDSLTYGLSDNAGGRFAIDSATGVITVANGSLLNHEANASHQITAQVTDTDGETHTQSFTITVTDLNETPTNLSLDTNSVNENAANGTTVGTLTGTDPDAGDSLTYGLSDNAGGRFAIDSATGAITVANGSLLNHEANASHQITAQVTDAAGENYTQTFTITVDDLNETPTNLSLDTNNVSENAANGTTVGTLTGTDPDAGDSLTYGLSDNAGGRFAIDSATGAITVANGSLLNHEANASHQITAQVTDAAGENYTQTFTITVDDLNETPTNLSLDTNNVSENAANGTAIGTLTGTDPDAGDSLTYGLSDNAGGRFAIDATTGAITVANGSLLNHEDNASHQITAQVTDADGETHTQTFTITVTDLNETPANLIPHSILHQENFDNGAKGWSTNMTENLEPFGEFLGRFSAVSESEILFKEFTLPGTQNEVIINFDVHEINDWNSESFFIYIDDTPVAVEVLNQNDQQENETHSFSFRVETTATTIKVGFGTGPDQTPGNTALGVDNLIITTNTSENLTISENATNGTAVGTLTGTDPDAGDSLTYGLTDTAGGRFAIDSATGAITVANGSLLNHEANTSHQITAQVTDTDGETHTQSFTINVLIAETDYLMTGFGQTARIDVLAHDAIGQDATGSVASVETPGHGVVVINPDNTISYTPNPGFSGEDGFTYVTDNGKGERTTATVFVNVTPPPHIQHNAPSLTEFDVSGSSSDTTPMIEPETAERVLDHGTNLEGQLSEENLNRALGAMAKILYDTDEEEFSQRILAFQAIQGDPLFFKGVQDQSSIWQDLVENNPFSDLEKTQEQTTEENVTQQQTNQINTSDSSASQPPATQENPEPEQENVNNSQQVSPDPNTNQENAPHQGFSAQLAKLSEGFERSRRDLVDFINRL